MVLNLLIQQASVGLQPYQKAWKFTVFFSAELFVHIGI